MNRFQKILVFLPLDHPEEGVIRAADRLAGVNGAQVTLMDVPSVSGNWATASGPALEHELMRVSRSRLEGAADSFKSTRPDVFVSAGVDFVEVIEQVFRGRYDIVMVGSSPRSEQSARLDPTITHLMRKCPVPVWVVDESHVEGSVLAAVGPAHNDESRALNRTILEVASSLAERQGSRLDVVHVWSVPGESLLFGSRVSMPRDEIHMILDEERRAAEEQVKVMMQEVPAADAADVHLLRGRPDDRLVEIIEELEPGVVVMGTLARRGIAGLIIGNTAERVLLTVDSSLIAVKPPWFESPVPPPAEYLAMD